MKRPRDYHHPTPAVQRSDPGLPLAEKIWCAVIVVIVVVAAAVWASVYVGRR